MEDNKTPRTLSEEEMKKVAGGFGFDEVFECAQNCNGQTPPKNYKYENGVCTCTEEKGMGGGKVSIEKIN